MSDPKIRTMWVALGEVGSHSDKTPKPLIHLPSNSFLAMLPAGGTKVFSNYEIGLMVYNIFEDLMAEKEPLCKVVASLNTVRRKGQQHISLVEVPEDDGVAE
ncbi:hypothetical protein B0H13DRAFT_1875465 [Mycena leptocephala]|nr:hypothetical protein B0H13DRAFT_1875465 [Mycena leptocephala]